MSGKIILIDTGTGNLRSVLKALESLDAEVVLTDDAAAVQRGDKLVLPGVGAFGDFMKGLRNNRLEEPIHAAVRRGVPLLGICVGMQALFETSDEMGMHTGLAVLPGRVVHFPLMGVLKVPHTGWNQLWQHNSSELFSNIPSGDYAYFNHSYYCVPGRPDDLLCLTDYGVKFASGVQHANIFGVQFHPEKSQRVGLKLLENFLNI